MRILLLIILLLSMLAQAKEKENCGSNELSIELAHLIINDKGQMRKTIRCNPILAKVAGQKAKIMAQNGMVNHDIEGSPNARLEAAGYKLPHKYGTAFGNQVESIAGGYSNAKSVWEAFKASDGHRSHLLGLIPFFEEQDEIGVGFYKKNDSPHEEYWVVYLAKGITKDQR